MPRRNRVQPDGELVAVPDRGTLWGNRGQLLDRDGKLARWSRGRNWLICVLEFKGRRRNVWTPGRLTELFFLDEATGLAAGHRPCGECRYNAYQAYKASWIGAHGGDPFTAQEIDAELHADRLAARATRRTYRDELAALPDGTMVELEGRPWLVLGDELLAWSFGGYQERRARDGGAVTVITPRASVAALAYGYRPELHPSAGR
jgi:hypothetical protein